MQVIDRLADGASLSGVKIPRCDSPIRDVDGRLGDAVHIDEPRPQIAMSEQPSAQRAYVDGFAAEDDRSKSRRCFGPKPILKLDQLAQSGRRLIHDGDRFSGQEAFISVRRSANPEGRDDEAATVDQGSP